MILSVHHSKSSIMLTIYLLLVKYKNTYCYPTRKTFLNHLIKYHKISISFSCLDQHLAELRDQGLIKSFRRWGRNPDGTVFNLPSNRAITLKGFNYLRSAGIKIKDWLWKWAAKGIRPLKPTGPKDDPTAESKQKRSGDAEPLGEIIDNMFTQNLVTDDA